MDFKPNFDVLAERRRHAAQTKAMAHSRHVARSNEGIIRRVWRTWDEWRKRSKRDAQIKARKAAHKARMECDPKYAARIEKGTRDYIKCRLNSCHNVDRKVYAMAKARGIEKTRYELVYSRRHRALIPRRVA